MGVDQGASQGPQKSSENHQRLFYVLPTFFDGRCCGFDRSLGVLWSSKERPGGSLGAPELTLGGLGGVPRERAPRFEAPRRGLGTNFDDPKESAHVQNTRISNVFS